VSFLHLQIHYIIRGYCDFLVRIQVLTATSMKRAAFWVVAPCTLVEFADVSEVCTASVIRAIVSAVSTSETSINFYWNTLH
jgi:hypothetical protein